MPMQKAFGKVCDVNEGIPGRNKPLKMYAIAKPRREQYVSEIASLLAFEKLLRVENLIMDTSWKFIPELFTKMLTFRSPFVAFPIRVKKIKRLNPDVYVVFHPDRKISKQP